MSNIEILKGKTILIGKEANSGRLLVSVKINDQPKMVAVGEINSVPNSVSRCKQTENTAHCKIEVDAIGDLIVTNLKPQNVTYVNGAEIISKKVKENGVIELGKDHFPVNVSTIVGIAAKIVAATCPPPPEEHSIIPLKQVWDEYHGKMKKIKIRQRNNGLLSSIPMAFTMLGGLIIGIAPDIREFGIVFTGIALLILLIGVYKRSTDKSIEETEEITEDFQQKYVCPKCHHFMGMQPYNILRQNKKCPWCGCLYTEK